MGGKSGFAAAVLALFTAFALVCGTWFLARTSSPEPYRVNTAHRPIAEEEEPEGGEDPRPDSLLPGERIDVNTADVYDLQRLPGIGEKRALDIIAWREEHGPFRSLDELVNISGIGPATLEGLRPYAAAGRPRRTGVPFLKERNRKNFIAALKVSAIPKFPHSIDKE